MDKLKILFVAAEVAPFSHVGGLSQVMYFLPRELAKLGHDVRIFSPKFGLIDEARFKLEILKQGLKIPTDNKDVPELICNIKVYRRTKRAPLVYFLENMEYYEKRANVYGYSDDPTRFALLSRGAIEFLKDSDWVPDIIHLNDWHTGYLANYLRTIYKEDSKLKKIPLLLTIHNLGLQGIFDFKNASPLEFDDGKSGLLDILNPDLKKQNSLKRGIIYSDIVNTVSEQYAREILTDKFGEGLEGLLQEVRSKIFGILNGLDNSEFDPQKDKFIKKNYSSSELELRQENKIDLQKEFGLNEDPSCCILAYSGRLDIQKGLDLVIEVLPYLLEETNIQFILLGKGEHRYMEFFKKLAEDFPGRVGSLLMSNWVLPRKIFAGADILLLPSKFEPGGIVILEGLRYGCVPVVRKTGGLADIVADIDIDKNIGTGFVFKKYSKLGFVAAIARALELYKCKRLWKKIIKRGMTADFSWKKQAEKYVDLYQKTIEIRKDNLHKKYLKISQSVGF